MERGRSCAAARDESGERYAGERRRRRTPAWREEVAAAAAAVPALPLLALPHPPRIAQPTAPR